MLGFKSFWSARAALTGIELWRMLKKGQGRLATFSGMLPDLLQVAVKLKT
jgi:hypothetical protein